MLSITTEGQNLYVDYERTMIQSSTDFGELCLGKGSQGNVRLLSDSTSYCVSKSQYLRKHTNSTMEEDHVVPGRKDWPTWIPDLSDVIIGVAKYPGLSIAASSNYNACGTMEGRYGSHASQQLHN